MTDMQPMPSTSPFDGIRHEDEQGEYWMARELAKALGYNGAGAWQNFERAIAEAKTASANQGYDVGMVFSDITKNPAKAGGRPSRDYRLTRFACYMIALSADGTKEQVAAAKVYFAVKTRLQELAEADPELLEWHRRAVLSYIARGYSREWAEQRVKTIVARNALTHEWSVRGIKDEEFPILTDAMHMDMFSLSIEEHKGVKNFPITRKGKRLVHKGELREAETQVELAITNLGEVVARDLHIRHDSQGFQQIARDVHEAGRIAGNARREIEAVTGEPVVSPRNMIKEPDGGLWAQLPAPQDDDA